MAERKMQSGRSRANKTSFLKLVDEAIKEEKDFLEAIGNL
jgi:hypothetical protein